MENSNYSTRLRSRSDSCFKQAAAVLAAALASSTCAIQAANIVWVGDYNDLAGTANDTFSAFTPAGGNNITDFGFINLLQNAGHNVIRYNSPGAAGSLMSQADLDALNTNDLVILGRAGNSPAFQSPKGLQWNTNIVKPIICMSPYFVRPDGGRLGWFTGGTLPDTSPTPGAPTVLTAGDPANAATDYLFAGVFMNGSKTVGSYDEMLDRNTSLISNPPVDGGIVYATANFPAEANGADTTAYVAVGFPAGTVVAAGRDVLAGYRLWLGGGSREGGSGFPTTVNGSAGRENLTAEGEGIFLRAVELALNNGVPPAVNPQDPLVFTLQPASITVKDGGMATFRASVSGPGPRTLTWEQGDGVTFTPIAEGSTPFSSAELTIPVTAFDDGAQYRLVASGPNGTIASDPAVLTVTPDSDAPVLLGAVSLDGINVTVTFDEVVEPNAAELAFSYTFTSDSGSQPISALRRPDAKSVDLIMDVPLSPNFTLTVTEIADLIGNAVAPEGVSIEGTSYGFTAENIGALNPGGGESGIDSGRFEVSGGGLDFQAAAEQMRLVYKSVEGDFDARIRVQSIYGTNRLESVAKAILTARATTATDSAAVNAWVTPPYPGDSTFGSTARTATGGPTISNHVAVAYGLNSTPATFPNAWLRIKREGDNFTTYNSSNGTEWNQLGSIVVAMGSPVLVGAGVNSHRNGQLATAVFSDFQFASNVTPPSLSNIAYSAGSFSSSFQTQNGVVYRVQYKDDLNAADWTDLTTITGDGAAKSFSDASSGARFYRVITP